MKRAVEVRRAADLLLRSNASSFTSFLAPGSAVRWTSKGQLISIHTPTPCIRRTFVSTTRNQAIRPSMTTSAIPPRAPSSPESPQQSSESSLQLENKSPSSQSGGEARDESVETVSRSLWSSRPSNRPSQFRTSSSADLLDAYTSSRNSKGSGIDLSRMLDMPSSDSTSTKQSPEQRELMNQIDIVEMGIVASEKRAPMRLNPSTGRAVTVGGAVDVSKAFRLVNMSCSSNKVRSDSNRQRFHERAGMKKKRLRRERWRKRFGQGFVAIVTRVKKLKKQGW